jgi:hypothetical protein
MTLGNMREQGVHHLIAFSTTMPGGILRTISATPKPRSMAEGFYFFLILNRSKSRGQITEG